MSHEAVNEDLAGYEWKVGDWAEYAGTRCLVIDVRGQLVDVVRRVGGEWADRFAGIHRSPRVDHVQVKPLPECDGWDWQPKPTYRPFANAVEFAPHSQRLIKWGDSYQVVRRFTNDAVSGTCVFTYSELLKNCQFADVIDGQFVYYPCGVEVTQ
jgi:hypothetical protein